MDNMHLHYYNEVILLCTFLRFFSKPVIVLFYLSTFYNMCHTLLGEYIAE